MFGYVTVNRDTLTEAEEKRFKEVYCGVCASLRRRGGQKARMTLSYDAAFLALILNALYEPEEEKGCLRCPAHPAHPREYAVSEMTDYAADVNMLLFYYSMLDKWHDDRSRTSLVISRVYRKRVAALEKRYPEKTRVIQEALGRLSALEKARDNNIDAAAGCFGTLLGEVYALREDIWGESLRRMGYALGRFIYLMDAWDDAEKDEKTGSFNPLVAWKGEADYEERVYEALKLEIAACAMEFERLPIVQDAGIIRNVLYSGVWCKYVGRKKEAQERKGKKA